MTHYVAFLFGCVLAGGVTVVALDAYGHAPEKAVDNRIPLSMRYSACEQSHVGNTREQIDCMIREKMVYEAADRL